MRIALVTWGILVSTALCLPAPAANLAADVIQKSFPANPGDRLVIQTDRGSITVSGSDRSDVSIEVSRKVKGGSEKKARELLDRHTVEMDASQGTIRIEADLEGENNWTFRGPQLEVAIVVQVPKRFHLDAQTAGGSVRVQNLDGNVKAKTAGGSVHLDAINGDVVGKTSGGSIHASELQGSADLSTAGGSIDVDRAGQGPVKVATSGGSLRLTGITGPLEARTAGGSIRIESNGAPIVASTSGGSVDATLTGVPTGTVDLRSSAGAVGIVLPAAAAVVLDASTSAGSVKSDFPVGVTDSTSRNSLKGPINGGGPIVKLRTSGGSVRVKKGS